MCPRANALFGQVARNDGAGVGFGVDFLLEVGAIELHVFVRVARIAIQAAEFAASIGIDRPGKRHAL